MILLNVQVNLVIIVSIEHNLAFFKTSLWWLTENFTRREVVQTLFKTCSFSAEQFESVMKLNLKT